MMQSMGIIIIGGLVASTILVLFLMPTFYVLISKKPKKNKKNKKGQTPPPPPPPPEVKEEIPTLEVVIEDQSVPLSTVDVPKFPEKPEVIIPEESTTMAETPSQHTTSDTVKSLPEGTSVEDMPSGQEVHQEEKSVVEEKKDPIS